MRKALLSVEKHFIPSCSNIVARHDASVLFELHNELTDAVIAFDKSSKKDIFGRSELVKKIHYCKSKIRSDLESDYDGVKLYRLIRVSALDRLMKVDKEAQTILNFNPL
jgi:hypothetical protein